MCKALQEKSFEYASDSLIPKNDSKENSKFPVKKPRDICLFIFCPISTHFYLKHFLIVSILSALSWRV